MEAVLIRTYSYYLDARQISSVPHELGACRILGESNTSSLRPQSHSLNACNPLAIGGLVKVEWGCLPLLENAS